MHCPNDVFDVNGLSVTPPGSKLKAENTSGHDNWGIRWTWWLSPYIQHVIGRTIWQRCSVNNRQWCFHCVWCSVDCSHVQGEAHIYTIYWCNSDSYGYLHDGHVTSLIWNRGATLSSSILRSATEMLLGVCIMGM